MSELTSARAVIEQLVDAMRRADPEYYTAHDLNQTSDREWELAIVNAEDWLADADMTGQRDEMQYFGKKPILTER
jgi:hypothetical protein